MIAVFAWAITAMSSERYAISSRSVLAALLYLGLVVNVIARLMQNIGQRTVAPGRAAIIFTLEPVVALLLSCLVMNERLQVRDIAGCTMIFAAMILAKERTFPAT